MSDSHVKVGNGSTTFVGKDAVMLYQVTSLRSAIKLYIKCGIIPTRGVTITKMLKSAGAVCNKKYKRTQQQEAVDDLTKWIDAMKAAIPVIN